MFGDGATAQERMQRIDTQRSILDAITGQVRRLQRGLGAGDRNRVAEYLDAVREIERPVPGERRQAAGFRRTCASSTAGCVRRPCAARVINCSSGRLLQRKKDSREASGRSPS